MSIYTQFGVEVRIVGRLFPGLDCDCDVLVESVKDPTWRRTCNRNKLRADDGFGEVLAAAAAVEEIEP